MFFPQRCKNKIVYKFDEEPVLKERPETLLHIIAQQRTVYYQRTAFFQSSVCEVKM